MKRSRFHYTASSLNAEILRSDHWHCFCEPFFSLRVSISPSFKEELSLYPLHHIGRNSRIPPRSNSTENIRTLSTRSASHTKPCLTMKTHRPTGENQNPFKKKKKHNIYLKKKIKHPSFQSSTRGARRQPRRGQQSQEAPSLPSLPPLSSSTPPAAAGLGAAVRAGAAARHGRGRSRGAGSAEGAGPLPPWQAPCVPSPLPSPGPLPGRTVTAVVSPPHPPPAAMAPEPSGR